MKIIRDCYNVEVENEPVSKQVECEHCSSVFEYESDDLQIGEFGCAYITCPCCGKRTWMDDEEGLRLTENNVVFPKHFWHCSVSAGAVHITKENINKYIKEGVKYLREHKKEFAYYTGTGDTCVIVFRFSGDSEYQVIVTQDYYETIIPFRADDFE